MPAQREGFTLIEIMVAITLVAILSTIGFATYHQAHLAAITSKVSQDFQAMEKNISIARIAQNKVMGQITGNWCTDCACRGLSVSRCATATIASYSKLTAEPLPTDPWGNIYTFDENEQEFGATDCRRDSLVSAGPDGILGNSDDYYYNVQPYVCN